MLGILGIFFENVTGENFVGNIGETLKLLLGKKNFCLGIWVKFLKILSWEKFYLGKLGIYYLGKFHCPYLLNKVFVKNFIKGSVRTNCVKECV